MGILNRIEGIVRSIDPQVADDIRTERNRIKASAEIKSLQLRLRESVNSLSRMAINEHLYLPSVFVKFAEANLKTLVICVRKHPDYHNIMGVQISKEEVALRDGTTVSLEEAQKLGPVLTLEEIEAIMRA